MQFENQRSLLDPEQFHDLAYALGLGDTPETVHAVHLLRQGTCKAYVAGTPSRFTGAVIQANAWPAEPVGFGSEPTVLWELLQQVKGWDCILVDSEQAIALGEIIASELGATVRYLDDVYHTYTRSGAVFQHETVQRLTLADLPLLESAPPELRASLWDSPKELLTEGVVACGIVSGRVVATALTTAYSDLYADVGVYAAEEHRCQGLATAAAWLVVEGVREAGWIPVWSAGEHNQPSLRVAHKLGFQKVSRRTYVIPRSNNNST